MNITTTFSLHWMIPVIIIAGLLAFWLYRRDKILGEQSAWLRILLGLFRFSVLSLLGFLMLEPMSKIIRSEEKKPVIAIVLDNSSSIVNSPDSAFYREKLPGILLKLSEDLSQKYDVETFHFDEKVKSGFNVDFGGYATDLSNLAEDLDTRFFNHNLGGVIIATDGNYNKGYNPVYAGGKPGAPVYPLVLGDTAAVVDLAVTDVIHNKIAFLGDDFPVEISLEARGLNGSEYTLRVYLKNKEVLKKKGKIAGDQWSSTQAFYIEAAEKGLQHYRISVTADKKEKVTTNNRETFYIDVIDERMKIALISAVPHPDVAVWKRAVSTQKNYELQEYYADDFKGNVHDFDLFILYQLPASKKQESLLRQVAEAGVPYLLIVGLKTRAGDIFPATEKYELIRQSGSVENFKVALNPQFGLFEPDKQFAGLTAAFPPLASRIYETKVSQPFRIVFTKKIGKLDSGIPVWMLSENTAPRNGIILGEGIWRWSMTAWSITGDHRVFDEFLLQNIKYLVRKDKKGRLRIVLPDEIYAGEDIGVSATFLNQSLEAVPDADIRFNITDENGNLFEYAFISAGEAYKLNLGALAPGDYSYTAVVNHNGEKHIKQGSFTVRERTLEQRVYRANLPLLEQWAEETGGQIFFPDEKEKMVDELMAKDLPVITYQTVRYVNFIQLGWIFFLIFVLATAEWFLRRFYGTY